MDLLEKIRQHIDEFIIMIVVGFISMGIYILSEKDAPLRHSFRLALMGFLIAQVFSLPIYYIMKAGSLWWLSVIVSILTICGQFLPELLQTLIPKIVKKQVKDRFGVDDNDHN